MLWNRRYVIKSYMRSSLWLMPFFALLGYMVVHRITYGIGAWLLRTGRIDETTSFFGLTMAGARAMLETIVTLNVSFIVFTFGSLLVAVQIAGGAVSRSCDGCVPCWKISCKPCRRIGIPS